MKQEFETGNGMLVLGESEQVLPVVGISIACRSGSLFDPEAKEGLTRMMTRALRMGTAKLRSRELEETLDRLGAQLSISCSQSYLHVGGVVLAHNFERFVALLAELLARPAFRPADVKQVQREMIAELTALCDDDRSLCARHFRSYAFGDHLYARPRSGTRASLSRISRADVIAQHRRHLRASNLVIGVSGAFAPKGLRALLERHLGKLARGKPQTLAVAEPVVEKGRRILVVDKPERTQTQILIGGLGTSPHDADHVALIVANTAFGGLFSARLTAEVRAKRGLSYGASSSFTLSRTRDLWAMHTFPAARDALACIELELELYARWVERGITAGELAAVKRYLEKGQPFEHDTAAKRVDQRLDVELLGWPKTHYSRFIERVKGTSKDDVRRALARRLSRADQVITLVATAKELLPGLEKLPGIARIDVVPFDAI